MSVENNPELNRYGEKKNNGFLLGPEYNEARQSSQELDYEKEGADPYYVKVAGLELHVDEDDPRSTQTLPNLRVLAREEEAQASK